MNRPSRLKLVTAVVSAAMCFAPASQALTRHSQAPADGTSGLMDGTLMGGTLLDSPSSAHPDAGSSGIGGAGRQHLHSSRFYHFPTNGGGDSTGSSGSPPVVSCPDSSGGTGTGTSNGGSGGSTSTTSGDGFGSGFGAFGRTRGAHTHGSTGSTGGGSTGSALATSPLTTSLSSSGAIRQHSGPQIGQLALGTSGSFGSFGLGRHRQRGSGWTPSPPPPGPTQPPSTVGTTGTSCDPCVADPASCNVASNGPGQVPEPGTLALVGLGLGGLAWMRRRRTIDR